MGSDLSGPLIAAAAVIALAVVFGGGARGDILSLIVLRPAAAILLAYGLWRLTPTQVRAYRGVFVFTGALVALVLLHLVPLPPAVWSALPGRALVAEIDRTAGLGSVWRPLSLAPETTWNALYSLVVPGALLVLGACCTAEERARLLPVVITLGAASAMIALLQLIGPPDGPMYFYRVTNAGGAVGLFSNRNHQAVLLAMMLPMLATYASLPGETDTIKKRAAIAIALAAFVTPLILITGSRAGLAAAILGVASIPLLYRPIKLPHRGGERGAARERPIHRRRGVRPIVLVAIAATVLLVIVSTTIALGRAEAFQRLLGGASGQEFRFRNWPALVDVIQVYLPFGSGIGSFIEVYKVGEPRELLDTTYLNHAHNDYLELLITGGLPAFGLLLAAAAMFGRQLAKVVVARRERTVEALFARLGLVLIGLLALASIGDYPLRTPSLAAVFALAVLWAGPHRPVGHHAIDAP